MAIESSWHSYPKIYAVGHAAVSEILHRDVVVEEKCDGSQFSFGAFPAESGEGVVLRTRSKGRDFDPEKPDDMFVAATATARDLFAAGVLTLGWTYRAEALKGHGHNVLKYDRPPHGGLVLFDVNPAFEAYLSYDEKAAEAARLGLEVVPALARGRVSIGQIERELHKIPPLLGGAFLEGVVLKPVEPYYGLDGKALIAKLVRDDFKEDHAKKWGEGSKQPGRGSVVDRLVARFAVNARYEKAFQHLRDEGMLVNAMQDIPALIAEVKRDLLDEYGDELREALFAEFHNDVARGVASRVPVWYKAKLADKTEDVVD